MAKERTSTTSARPQLRLRRLVFMLLSAGTLLALVAKVQAF